MVLEGVPVKIIGKNENDFDGGARYCSPTHEVLALNIAGRTAPAGNDLVVFAGRPNMPVLLVQETISSSQSDHTYCFLWDTDENTYVADVTDNDGCPVTWPIPKIRIQNWLSENLTPSPHSEAVLEKSQPTAPPYPYCETTGGWNQTVSPTVWGLQYDIDHVCPEHAAHGVDWDIGVGGRKNLHERLTSNMEPNDPRLPETLSQHPNKGVYEALGTWNGSSVNRRYIWVRIKGVHTGDAWPYQAVSQVTAGGSSSASQRGYYTRTPAGGRLLGRETTTTTNWTANLTCGFPGFYTASRSIHYWSLNHSIREPYSSGVYRYEVDWDVDSNGVMLTAGVAGSGFGRVGRIVMFAHWSLDIKETLASHIDSLVSVDSRYCTIYDTGIKYDELDPLVHGQSNTPFNAAYRELVLTANQYFSPIGTNGYHYGLSFTSGSGEPGRGYICMPWTPGQIILPGITAYDRKT